MKTSFYSVLALFLLGLLLGVRGGGLVAAELRKPVIKTYSFGTAQKFRAGFDGRTIVVELQPRTGDGIYRFASWTLRNWKNTFNNIKKFNKYRPLQKGRFVRFPFKTLNDRIQSMALQALFSNDTSEADGWAHRVVFAGETVSLIAGVFAKEGISPNKLIKYNGLKYQGTRLKQGDTIVIPWKWVKEELNLNPVSVRKPLYVKTDKAGKRWAYYRIVRGESLYSAVVVRFTGRTLADDVNEMARELLKLNGIADEHHVLAGAKLKIPLEWISEEYLVQKTAMSRAVEPEPKPEKKAVPKKDRPIHIILDSGHGGRDPGATIHSGNGGYIIFEDEAVYDIGLRMGELLKARNYVVHATLKDPNQPRPIKWLAVKKDEDEILQVHPSYDIRNVKVGVNMRVYLVNHIYHDLVYRQKVPSSNILLMSLHADALHSSLRGVSVYFPDRRLRVPNFNLTHRVYRRRREYRRNIRFGDWETRRAAKLSAALGKNIIQTCSRNHMRTLNSLSVRGYYYRRGKRTLPAILRYSKVPTSVLVEVGNLNNRQDRSDLLQADFRQRIAATLVDSIKNHF
ncbi:MAG: LysM peptidoglycan-binding domain-containing protein [Proteobacteria bacterium]|nr:LysM peptidoglycan-binding domain-containing protein [Pseudomonadota bacterium]